MNLIGKTKEEAIKELEESNTSYRITREDDKSYIVTRDYRPSRYNLEITNGIVTKVFMA